MKIRFAFHKPEGERGIGKAIVAWTWILGLFYNWKVLKYNYSHEEVWLPDRNGDFERAPITYSSGSFAIWGYFYYGIIGRCFSSTTRGKWNGVRFAPAIEVIGKHPERWVYIECDVDAERLEVTLEEAEKLVGGGYDYAFILSFLQPFYVQKPEDWACSEILDWFKFMVRVHRKRHGRISPRRAAYLLTRKYGEPKPVV